MEEIKIEECVVAEWRKWGVPHFRHTLVVENLRRWSSEGLDLSEEQMKVLLSMPDAGIREGFRALVLLSVLYDTGARVQELADLRVKDIRIERPSVVTLHGKENKIRQGSGYDKYPETAEKLSGALPL